MTGPLADVDRFARAGDWTGVLDTVIARFGADSGTLHLTGADDLLHLAAASAGIPAFVLDTIRVVPIGKGMAGLAVERRQPVVACNIQTDSTGDVRPGALATGLQGSIVVPLLNGDAALGALGIANRGERTFTPSEQADLLAIARDVASVLAARRSRT